MQTVLADTLGYDELDLVTDLLSHRSEIITSAPASKGHLQSDGLIGGLQTKEQRAETLRRQALDHKNAPLADSVQRTGPSYPHVYKAHEAGNTLSAYGRRYALPSGSQRQEHEVSIHSYFRGFCTNETRNTRSTLSLQRRSELLAWAGRLSRSTPWMAFVNEPSKDTNH